MIRLVLLRHGESVWNKENRFTGWYDVDLSERGRAEAEEAGRLLREGGFTFDVAYTSVLKRAIRTLWATLDALDLLWIPVAKSWRLNERHYGALQGLNKAETAAKHGEAQVKVWRRSYDVPPPALTPNDPHYPGRDPRYAGLTPAELPLTESLKDTVDRFLPVLARDDRPGDPIGQACRHRRPRQQPSGARQVPGRHPCLGNRGAEHPHGHPARVRAGRQPQAPPPLLPGRSGRGRGRSCQSGCSSGRENVERGTSSVDVENEKADTPCGGRPFSAHVLRSTFYVFFTRPAPLSRLRQSATSGGNGDRSPSLPALDAAAARRHAWAC